jgi:phosphate:Na+ symporter
MHDATRQGVTVLVTLGGLALFLLGIHRIATALQSVAGPSTRRWMARATRSPWRALGSGTAVSAATQSGTATAVTALGLVSTGLVAVPEGIALSLGAKVGATLAIQLAAFRIAEFALPMIGVGYLLTLWRSGRQAGGFLLGAGMLFLGLDLTVTSVGALEGSELFALIIDGAERQPLLVAALGVLVGAALSSANAAAAVALGLFAAGAVSLPTALALMVGGNVGSTVLPILAARSLDVAARRVAYTHLVVKALGALAVIGASGPIGEGVAALGGDGARQIANAHTLFNLAVALPATLLAGPLARLAARAVPAREELIGPKYLRPAALSEPALAAALALRETVRISDQVAVMMELAVGFVRRGQWDGEPIAAREVKVDTLTQTVVDYLARLRRQSDQDVDAISERLLLAATELEHMGDQVRRLYRREERLRDAGVEFSREGRAELADTGERVLRRMRAAFTALATGDVALARTVIEGRPALEQHVAAMRVAHLARLEAQLPESRASSSNHLEVLTLFRQLDASVTRVAGWALQGVVALRRPEERERGDAESGAVAGGTGPTAPTDAEAAASTGDRDRSGSGRRRQHPFEIRDDG